MRVSTIIFIDGEERQVWAQSLTIGEPSEHLVRVDLGDGDGGEMIIHFCAIRMIVTQDLAEDAISPEILGSPRP